MKGTCLRCSKTEKLHKTKERGYEFHSYTKYWYICTYCYQSLNNKYGHSTVRSYVKKLQEEKENQFDSGIKTYAVDVLKKD
jgi:hypothetical protein